MLTEHHGTKKNHEHQNMKHTIENPGCGDTSPHITCVCWCLPTVTCGVSHILHLPPFSRNGCLTESISHAFGNTAYNFASGKRFIHSRISFCSLQLFRHREREKETEKNREWEIKNVGGRKREKYCTVIVRLAKVFRKCFWPVNVGIFVYSPVR